MEEQKKDSLFWIKVILFSVIVIIISIAVLISTHASHQKNKEKLREYSDYLNSYLEENFPEQYSVETSGTVFTVHVWEPGTVLSDVEDETLIRDKYGKLAKQLWLEDPQYLLIQDVKFAFFGTRDVFSQFVDRAKGLAHHTVVLKMKKES